MSWASQASAGPPYETDDPEPTDFRHWEIFLGWSGEASPSGQSHALPQLDINYGALPDLQATLVLQASDAFNPPAPNAFGLGDTTLGLKYRFLHESEKIPEAALFPQIVLPSGNANLDLGNGQAQLMLPLWFQKNWPSWSSFWGGAYWINPGPANLNWLYLGWALQHDFNAKLSLGVELFYHSPSLQGQEGGLGSNLAALYSLDSANQLMASAGRDLIDGNYTFTGYAAWRWTP